MDDLDVDALPVGIVKVDRADRIVAANAWFCAWAGEPSPVGEPIGQFLVQVPDFLDETETATLMVSSRDSSRATLVVRVECEDGATLTLMEASDRYASGQELRESHRLADRTRARLQLIMDASTAFGAATSEERLGEILADTAARAYRAEEAVVYLQDDDGTVRRVAGANLFERVIPDAMLTRAATELREVVKLAGVAEAAVVSPEVAEAMRSTGVQAVIVAPLRLDGVNYGFFACFFRHPREFDDEASPLAEALAGQAAQKLATVRLQRRLEHAATHDETTGLPNRRRLEELATVLDKAGQASVVFIDLDGFKDVNDQLGHEVGDEVLREVARRLTANVRESDVVARYGGDEFVVVCDADAAAAAEVADRLRAAIEDPFDFLPGFLTIGASIGVATVTADAAVLNVDRLIRGADQAMYLAKSRGGNQVVVAG